MTMPLVMSLPLPGQKIQYKNGPSTSFTCDFLALSKIKKMPERTKIYWEAFRETIFKAVSGSGNIVSRSA
jgi:hypothetical protein